MHFARYFDACDRADSDEVMQIMAGATISVGAQTLSNPAAICEMYETKQPKPLDEVRRATKHHTTNLLVEGPDADGVYAATVYCFRLEAGGSGPVVATAASPLGLPIVAWHALGLAVVAWYLLEHSPVGRRFYATGANADAARLAGVRTSRVVVCSFVVTGLVAGLAGVLATAKVGQVSPSIGPPYLLPAFAACFLGTTQLKMGRFNVWGTVLANYLLAPGIKGVQLVGGQLWITDLFNSLALAGAVGVAVVSQRRHAAVVSRTTSRARTQ
ncbi:branched-subunit amino acid transport system permease [Micromonospora kangleipakensis]|uniref:Branched-subunit amino acid transport system permease n=1 Tax=Micromonospora kangleipakensis TaxID=1077942 RepID=A0A4Q8BAX8_9ACTN|nr:ABC transporter permease [Micromonospora kangleipakensis]RZU74947.1 branched-subunit amino acid transport system permease [Micromonospora kangleipakensis]